jgi:hypothetical protein
MCWYAPMQPSWWNLSSLHKSCSKPMLVLISWKAISDLLSKISKLKHSRWKLMWPPYSNVTYYCIQWWEISRYALSYLILPFSFTRLITSGPLDRFPRMLAQTTRFDQWSAICCHLKFHSWNWSIRVPKLSGKPIISTSESCHFETVG